MVGVGRGRMCRGLTRYEVVEVIAMVNGARRRRKALTPPCVPSAMCVSQPWPSYSTCRLKNFCGSAGETVLLIVIVPPGPNTLVWTRAQADSGSVTLVELSR